MQRSEELRLWIKSLNPDGDIEYDLQTIPEGLRKELLNEAFEQFPKFKEEFDQMDNDFLPISICEDLIIEKYYSATQFVLTPELCLPGWKEDNVPCSVIFGQSAFFSHANQRKQADRSIHHQECVLRTEQTIVLHNGEVLSQNDWDVYHALLSLSEGYLNQFHSIEPGKIFTLIGHSDSGYNYESLRASLTRLANSSIQVIKIRNGSQLETDDWMPLLNIDSQASHSALKFSLPLGLVKIFSDSDYGFIDWNLRNRVAKNALAKRLMCLIACSKQNQQFYRASRLLEESGFIAAIDKFTRSLKRALDVLLDIGFIKAYWLEKPRRGCAEKKSICIWKDKAPATAQNPKGMRGSYFDASQLGE